jgi:hypothetical protein
MKNQVKLAGAEKFGFKIVIDPTLTRNPGETSFPKKVNEAKKMLANLQPKR